MWSVKSGQVNSRFKSICMQKLRSDQIWRVVNKVSSSEFTIQYAVSSCGVVNEVRSCQFTIQVNLYASVRVCVLAHSRQSTGGEQTERASHLRSELCLHRGHLRQCHSCVCNLLLVPKDLRVQSIIARRKRLGCLVCVCVCVCVCVWIQ